MLDQEKEDVSLELKEAMDKQEELNVAVRSAAEMSMKRLKN